MNQTLSLRAVGLATSALIAISYVLCIVSDQIMPAHELHSAWQTSLLGFHWLSWPMFFLGLVESYAFGWYIALIWVPLYNISVIRRARMTN